MEARKRKRNDNSRAVIRLLLWSLAVAGWGRQVGADGRPDSNRGSRDPVGLVSHFGDDLGGISADWRTHKHEPGYCAMYGECGHRSDDHSPLSCPSNRRGAEPTDEVARKLQETCPSLWAKAGGKDGRYCCDVGALDTLKAKTEIAGIFVMSCPACFHNFKAFFCELVCSPDQATFTNVTKVQRAADTNRTVVKEVSYFVDAHYGQSFFNSCKDVVYGTANQPAMMFIGGGAKTFQQWFDFMGDVKDKTGLPTGSPFQIDFPSQSQLPPGMDTMSIDAPSCGDSALRCSCGDCPDAPNCALPPVEPPPPRGCQSMGLGGTGVTCADVALIAAFVPVAVALMWLYASGTAKRLANNNKAAGSCDADTAGDEPTEASTTAPLLPGFSPGLGPGPEHQPAASRIEAALQSWFYHQGQRCARYPWAVLLGSLALTSLLCIGLVRFRIVTDPQKLWVGPNSDAARDKTAFDAAFGPFYRITQLILSTTPTSDPSAGTAPSGLPSIVTSANLDLVFDIHDELDALVAKVSVGNATASLTVQDVCYKPFGDTCAVQSVAQYWQMSRATWRSVSHLSPEFCFSHWSTQCRTTFQAPEDPHVVLGGFPTDPAAFRSYERDATAFLITVPVSSRPEHAAAALAWEAAFLQLAEGKLARMAAAANLTLSFSAERSIQDELARESGADIGTVALSYVAMLLYIAAALGRWGCCPGRRSWRHLLVESRLGVGLSGVAIVLLSVLGALGICAAAGVWSTLIIMEVIPFLVLAVGVDNMFILTHALQRQPPGAGLEQRCAGALAAAGPSVALAAVCEVLAFALAQLTPMPAVRNFSLCAALAVLLDFLLQVTAFPAVLALDERRAQLGLADCLPCVQAVRPAAFTGPTSVEDGTEAEAGSATVDSARSWSVNGTSWLSRYMTQVHVPFLMRPAVQFTVMLLATAGIASALALVQQLPLGLEQSVALPRDSYLQDYFRDVLEVGRVGPPLMFVVHDVNLSSASPDVASLCSSGSCRNDSLLTRIAQASRRPETSFVAAPAASWVDDFSSWISPELNHCCRAFPPRPDDGPGGAPGHRYCPPPDQPPCSRSASACANCSVCVAPGELSQGLPLAAQYRSFLPWFLQAKPSVECAKGGAGVYSDTISRDRNGNIVGLDASTPTVASSYFRTYTTPLSAQSDFINALAAARKLAADASRELGLRVRAYSVFHIFFEQYLTIRQEAVLLLLLAVVAVGVSCAAMTESVWAAAIIGGVVGAVVLDMVGLMAILGVQLNAVSLTNLVMAVGIAVEFCAHIVHSFLAASGSRYQRVLKAMELKGASVAAGIAATKLVGVSVLALSRTDIFVVYYFRMYMALVALASFHGLVVLPVVLAVAGPPARCRQPQLAVDEGQVVYGDEEPGTDGTPAPLVANGSRVKPPDERR